MTAAITIRDIDDKASLRPLPRVALENGLWMPGTPDGSRATSSIAIAVVDEKVVGMVSGHLVGRQAAARTSAPGVAQIYHDLEAQVAGTWFIDGLAADRDWKEQGIEQRLLRHVESLAEKANAAGLSTIVGTFASDLIRFFETEGFSERARAEGAYSLGIRVTWALLTRETVH